MKYLVVRFRTLASALLLALFCAAGISGSSTPQAQATIAPSWQTNAVIYCIYPQIFSSSGLSGITAQITRLKNLGVTVLWLMPFQPLGTTITIDGTTHYPLTPPTPYCQSNLTGIDSAEGSSSDLTNLITAAHNAGMHVIMDVAINQTAWSDPLVTSTPQYYYHSDGNLNNAGSIEEAFGTDSDIAWVDILNNNEGAQTYMTSVCQYWLTNFSFDGFRFDSADNPSGSNRALAQSYAESLASSLDPNNTLLWLGEENNNSLAFAPYTLDYDWDISYGGDSDLQNTAKNGSGVSQLESQVTAYSAGNGGYPSGFEHMDLLQDWDTPQDYDECGGYSQVLDAAAFDLTIPGVPLVYNGEEVGNDQGSDSLNHTAIDWSSPNASKFQSFYTTMISNRAANPALQQGTLVWESNSNNSSSVATYDRVSGSNECYVEINFSGSTVTGTCTVPSGSGTWTDISPSVSPGGTSHTLPSTGNFSLAPYDYAVFKRGAATAPGTPTGVTATPGNAQVTVSWTAVSGATSYSVYRSTTSGGEGTTAYNAGITTTSFVDTSVTAGTTYYYKVAAVNSSGTSAQSSEVHAAPTVAGSLSGSVASFSGNTNLTSVGTTDWAAYGYGSGYEHKSGGGTVSNVSAVGGSLNTFPAGVSFTWTNGTPDASETNANCGYYNQGGNGDGFQFTVPASTTVQHVTVYLGGYNSGGTLTATLSDGSASAYSNASQSSSGSYYSAYTLTFNAASSGQTLTVKWLQNNGGTNVTLYGAALH